ncbi:MAG TPA: bifunctional hydroxymethylpyrimidine kinase/phosphomethylpyrimidine kinase [Methanocorpusculum sp.]|nr:bifunctional hydroxymethylpyrimidine kinase/phosphomethylpyrimidine kinase [Methanocorpusculum sp.]
MNYPNQAFAVSVAGSDSSCGAGTQVDLKTMSACGVWGLTVIAALTAQNVNRVISSTALPMQFIREQFAALEEEYPIGCYKTGMLMNAETVTTVAGCIPKDRSLVVDPVLISTSGFRLMDKDGENALCKNLLPRATVITPNIPEAETLSGVKIESASGMEKAAEWFLDAGAKSVIIKGGHAEFRRGTDLFMDANGPVLLEPEISVPVSDVHGSGCCFASAISSHIALGYPLPDAVREAKKFVTGAILYSVPCPSGRRMMNPNWQQYKAFDKKY